MSKKSIITLILVSLNLTGCAAVGRSDADRAVDRFCSNDGGNHIYHTVKLPSSQFDRNGFPRFIDTKGLALRLGPDYTLNQFSEPVSGSASFPEKPYIIKYTYAVVRNSDSVLLGQNINYVRVGGDRVTLLPTAHSCNAPDVDLLKQIFIAQ